MLFRVFPCLTSPRLELDPGGGAIDVDFLSVPPLHPSELLLDRGSRVFKVPIEGTDHLVNRFLHGSLR